MTPYYAVLQYDGGRFAGWQKQATDRTVQGEFEAGLERLESERVVTHAAGRTDSGVHALGQTVSFALRQDWDVAELTRALRSLLPPDVWLVRLERAPRGFHARKHATSRRYRYAIGWDDAAFSPFRRPYEWALSDPLDLPLLGRCATQLMGTHDFRAFSAVGQSKPHYRSKIIESRWDSRGLVGGCIFTVEADRFLHRMVRFLVGTMVEIAQGRRPFSDLERLLTTRTNQDTSPPAPPHGLYFVGARYPQLDEGSDR